MNATLQDKINKVAYELYEKSGRQKGNDLPLVEAEKIVHSQQMIQPMMDGKTIRLLQDHFKEV